MSLFERVYAIVRRIPRGRVATYGEIAREAGLRGGARTVGWALASLPDAEAAPWWRVLPATGRIAGRRIEAEQRKRLLAERVRVDAAGRIDIGRYGWSRGSAARRRSDRG